MKTFKYICMCENFLLSVSCNVFPQARGFISLAKLGGGVWLTTEICLRQATWLFTTAGLPNRGHTHQGLLWSLVEARALLLEATKEKKEAIRPCQELSGLLATCGLEKNNQLRAMKMRVRQCVFTSISLFTAFLFMSNCISSFNSPPVEPAIMNNNQTIPYY